MKLKKFVKLNEGRSLITSGIIFQKGDKILGIRGPGDKGKWDIPKGQTDKGEDPLKTARRETQEEIGYKPKISKLEDLGTFKFMKNRLLHLHRFTSKKVPRKKDMEATSKIVYKGEVRGEKEDFEWIPILEIPKKFKSSLIKPLKRIFPNYFKGF